MTIYKGILRSISGGNAYRGLVTREFVNIGNNHIKKFSSSEYLDEILLSLMDEEITISVVQNNNKSKTDLIAIKSSNGTVYKKDIGSISLLINIIFTSGVLGLLAIFGGGILFAITDDSLTSPVSLIIRAVTIGVIIYAFINPFILYFKILKAKNEL